DLLRLPSQLPAGQFTLQSPLHLLDLAAHLLLQGRQRLGLLLEPSLAPLAMVGKEPIDPLNPCPSPARPAWAAFPQIHKISPLMAPAIGQLKLPVRAQQRKVAGIPVHVLDPGGPWGKEILRHLS